MKRALLLIAMLLAAIFIGSLIGESAATSVVGPYISKEYSLGLSTFDLDMKVLVITFGLSIHICIAQIVLILLVLFTYPKIAAYFFKK